MGNSFSNNEAIDNDDTTILAELSLVLVTLELVSSHLDDQETCVQHWLDKLRKEEKQEMHRQQRIKVVERPKRKTFTDITQRLTERQFQRTFRMQRKSFYKLRGEVFTPGEKGGKPKYIDKKYVEIIPTIPSVRGNSVYFW
jgi:hypothetical protein